MTAGPVLRGEFVRVAPGVWFKRTCNCPYCGQVWPAAESEAAFAHLFQCPKNPSPDRRRVARVGTP